jgi:hypothetical protein
VSVASLITPIIAHATPNQVAILPITPIVPRPRFVNSGSIQDSIIVF